MPAVAEQEVIALVKQIVYQTVKAIEADHSRFSFGYGGRGYVVDIPKLKVWGSASTSTRIS